MESNSPLGSIIGFDAATLGAPGSVNRNRRSTDPGNQAFAEVYDLATYAASGSRRAARVELAPAAPQPAPSPLQAVPAPGSEPLAPIDRAAADRLYLHLTTGGSWLRVTDDRSGTVVMRLHDAGGAPVRELSITELAGGHGPEVA